jgi:hypothetical protein
MQRFTVNKTSDIQTIKHIDNKIKIVEAYDTESEFFVVNGIKCHYKRNKAWGNKVNSQNWHQQVKQENRIKYQAIIFIDNSFQNVVITMESLLQQSIPPQHITVVRYTTNTIRPSVLSDYLDHLELPWQIHNVVDLDMSNLYVVNDILRTRAYPYYTLYYAGHCIPEDFFNVLNTQIYDKHVKFAILTNNNKPMVIATFIHNVYCGNKKTSLIEKIKQDQCHNLIIPIQKIYPNYPK